VQLFRVMVSPLRYWMPLLPLKLQCLPDRCLLPKRLPFLRNALGLLYLLRVLPCLMLLSLPSRAVRVRLLLFLPRLSPTPFLLAHPEMSLSVADLLLLSFPISSNQNSRFLFLSVLVGFVILFRLSVLFPVRSLPLAL